MTVRIFWPSNVLDLERQTDYQPSLVIGWKNGPYDLVVVTTLPYLEPHIVELLLNRDDLLKGSQSLNITSIYQLCGAKKMSILGTLNCDNLRSTSSLMFEATLNDDLALPDIRYISSNTTAVNNVNSSANSNISTSISASNTSTEIQLIMFDPPNSYSMQFFSIAPISFEISQKNTFSNDEDYERVLAEKRQIRDTQVQLMYSHGILDRETMDKQSVFLKKCLAQINCTLEMGEIMRSNAAVAFPKLKERSRRRTRRRLSVSEVMMESAKTVQNGFLVAVAKAWTVCSLYFASTFIYILMAIRILVEIVLKLTTTKIPYLVTGPAAASPIAIKDLSATAQQIDLRCQQFCFWPVQYLTIRKRKTSWSGNTDFNVEYIRYYNSIWLVVNDVILGAAIGGLILDNKDLLVSALSYLIDETLGNFLQKNTLWLMNWPAGLKLNNELATFIGEFVLWVIYFWTRALGLLKPYYGSIVEFIGLSCFFGTTLAISMLSDLLSFVTLHIYSFYVASARIYHWQLMCLQSLFHLFRGKKHNVLRNRIDSNNYDLDQLLMGTIFFTVLIFLLPTVLVFYLFFAFSRLCTVLTCASLEFVLTCLNHFPLFAILLRLKDSRRVPGGIRFEVMKSDEHESVRQRLLRRINFIPKKRRINQTAAVVLKPVPLGLARMFNQYYVLSERFKMHYLSFRSVKHILTGQFVPIQRGQLYHLLYSTLPNQRVPIQELYAMLTGENDKYKEER